jgi:hypothetical protein
MRILWLAAATIVAILSSSCASTSVQNTWKSPDYKGGPAQKIAVVADDYRSFVRVALENRFVNQLQAASQPAFATARSFPDLAAARKNKEATVARLRADGAENILITRLVSKSDYVARAQQNYTGQFSGLTVSHNSEGWDTSIGSYSTYSTTPRSDDRSYLVLDTSLFELNTGQRIWGCATEVTVKETDDRLEIADAFVTKVVHSMRQDGMIR